MAKKSIFELHFCKSWDFPRVFSRVRVQGLGASQSIRDRTKISIFNHFYIRLIPGAGEKIIKISGSPALFRLSWRQTADKPNNIPTIITHWGWISVFWDDGTGLFFSIILTIQSWRVLWIFEISFQWPKWSKTSVKISSCTVMLVETNLDI